MITFDQNTEVILAELEAARERRDYPNIDRQTAEDLHLLVLRNKPKFILELGAANGYSTIWLGLAAKQIGAKVMTFEFSGDRYPQLVKNIARVGLESVISPRFADIMTTLPSISGAVDFVFVDAMKAQYKDYMLILEDKLVPGATIVADNVFTHSEKLQNFVDYVKNSPIYEVIQHDPKDRLMIIKFLGK